MNDKHIDNKSEQENKIKDNSQKSEKMLLAEIELKSKLLVAFINRLPFIAIVILIFMASIVFKNEIKSSLSVVDTFEYAGVKIKMNPQETTPPKLEGGTPVDIKEWKAAKRRALDVASVLKDKRILWVDDHPENNTEIVNFLTSFKMQVSISTNNQDAYSMLKTSKVFDIVITDIGRDHEENPNLPKEDSQNKSRDVGLDLVKRSSAVGYSDRILVYSGSFASEANDSLRKWPVGAYGVTDRADELLNFIIDLCHTAPAPQRGRW